MRNITLMTGAALGAMSAAERAMGRYMRSPDEHPAPAEPAPAAEPAAEAPAAPAEGPKTTDDLYDAEFGAAKFGDDEEGDVEPPAPAEPTEPEAEKAEPEGAEEQQPKPDTKPATPTLEDRLAAAEEEAREARREARELREQLQPKPKEEERQQEANPEDGRPDPEDYEFGEADSKYITKLAEWTAEKRFEALMADRDSQNARNADYEAMQSNWDAQISAPEVAEQYPDFQQKVVEGANRGEWHCSPVMTIAIKSSPVARDIAYELASNAAESQRISALPPMEQALEIGRLEGKYLHAPAREAAPDPAPSPSQAPVKPSKAPSPPPARARGAGGQFSSELDQTYERMLSEFN